MSKTKTKVVTPKPAPKEVSINFTFKSSEPVDIALECAFLEDNYGKLDNFGIYQ